MFRTIHVAIYVFSGQSVFLLFGFLLEVAWRGCGLDVKVEL